MMPTLNAIIRKDEKISTGACVGFFGILSALIGLLGTALPPPRAHGLYIKNVNKKFGRRSPASCKRL